MPKLYAYFFAIFAYFIWGLSPIYFKLIEQLPAIEIIIHRVIWSAVCCILLIFSIKKKDIWKPILTSPKKIFILFATGIILSVNWLTYVWAINNEHMLEASLGYYITPLISVLLGTVLLKEKMRKFQWAAVTLAILGVLIQIVLIGKLPWVSILLALTFSFYGLIRKIVPINVIPGMVIETWLLVPVALIWLSFHTNAMTLSESFWQWHFVLLVMLGGPLTLVPLILFNLAAKHLPYSSIGFLQYIGPTIMFFLAIFYFHEDFAIQKLLTFGFIWLALVLFSLDSYFFHRSRKKISR